MKNYLSKTAILSRPFHRPSLCKGAACMIVFANDWCDGEFTVDQLLLQFDEDCYLYARYMIRCGHQDSQVRETGVDMHRTEREFELRAASECNRPVRAGRVGASLLALGFCLSLAACAEDLSYPSVAGISDIGTVLSREERQKTVEDLQKQQNHAASGRTEVADTKSKSD
jgi:hypothetical protein